MKILITGASGMLGRKILTLAPKKYTIYPTFYKNTPAENNWISLNIENKDNVDEVVRKVRPNIIIHTASLGNVDFCEQNQKKAWRINVEGTNNIVHAAKGIGAKVVFCSSNAVFDGTDSVYDEKAKPNPINYYGKTKLIGETSVKQLEHFLIFRLNTIYGWSPKGERINPVEWILNRLKNNISTYAVDDVFNNHLWVNQAALSIWSAIKKERTKEIFHIAGKNCLSRYDFFKIVSKTFKYDLQLLKPVQSDFFETLALRPKKTCFDTSRMEKFLRVKPITVSQGIKRMKKEYEE